MSAAAGNADACASCPRCADAAAARRHAKITTMPHAPIVARAGARRRTARGHRRHSCAWPLVVVGLTRSSGRIAVLIRAGRAPVLILATMASFFRSTATV